MGQDPLVHIDNLSYQYPRAKDLALRDVNLSVRRGEFLGLVGPTGAGKTTLCLALSGVVPQFFGGRFYGQVTVAGLDTVETPISLLAQHVASVFQDPDTQLIANSVQDEIAFALENICLLPEEIRRRIAWAVQAVRLQGLEGKHPSELSGGEKQRLAIAAALALQPEVLVLDEPTSQLDPVGSQEVFATVRELNAELGITVVLASHASEELAGFADRIALLAEGQLVDVDTPRRIFARPDLLSRYATRPPQVAQFYQELARRGMPAPSAPVTLEQATASYEALHEQIQLRLCEFAANMSAASGPPLLSVRGLEHVYPDGTRALQGISLDVQKGEYLAILGQNGAGKTTLVKHFLRLLQPTAGQVLVDGQDVGGFQVSELARRIGFVSQNPDSQIFSSTVEAEVGFALRNLGMNGPALAERVEQSLQTMGLVEHRSEHPLSLSKGDRARVVIAAVLAMQPDILIFDEPTTGQDYRGAQRILDISRELHQAGKTIMVITHHLHLLPGYARRIIVMGKGVILLDAPIRQALHDIPTLSGTFLSPPQIVQFALWLASREQVSLPVLTPEELAACFRSRVGSA
ncbi:MAG: ATP-binding cassette domain-containing protein [Chloroflexi bacterium]|nr:ATP-binding cassette domain-containing protein [Chloroflexota bacterium]